MIRVVYSLITVSIFFSCNNRELKYSRKKIGDKLYEAHFLNDSLIEGEAKIYKDDKLIAIEHYNHSVKNGPAISFYSKGNIYDSLSFSKGLENGYYYVYDSSGNLAYVSYYFNGLKVGPEIYYHNGKVRQYFFNSFEKANVYYNSYDSLGNRTESLGRPNNSVIYSAFKDGQLADGVFAFFVHPPRQNINYQLIERDSMSKKETVIKIFHDEVFFDTILLRKNLQSSYFIKADVYDSVKTKRRLFYDQLNYLKKE